MGKLLLAATSAVVEVLTKVGIGLGVLLAVLAVTYWIVQPFKRRKAVNREPSRADLQYANRLAGFEKRNDEREISVDKVRYDEEKAREEQRKIDEEKEREREREREREMEREREKQKAIESMPAFPIFSEEKPDGKHSDDKFGIKDFFTEHENAHTEDAFGKAFDFSKDKPEIKSEHKPGAGDFGIFGKQEPNTQDAFGKDAFAAFGRDAFAEKQEPAKSEAIAAHALPSESSFGGGSDRNDNLDRTDKTDREELAQIRREIEDAKRELASQREQLARERAEMQERAKKAEFDREMEKRMAEIDAIQRDMERERQLMFERRGGGAGWSQYSGDAERERFAREDRARRADFEREMAKRIEQIEKIVAQSQRDHKRFAAAAELEKIGAFEEAEREKREAFAEAEEENAENIKKSERAAENAANLVREKSEVAKQLELYRAELAKHREQTQAQIAAERADQIEKMKQQFTLYTKEVDRQLSAKAEAGEHVVLPSEFAADVAASGDSAKVLISELIEDRKAARAEAEQLRAELDAERRDSQRKLQEQFEILKQDLARQKNEELEKQVEAAERNVGTPAAILEARQDLAREYQDLVDELKREHETNEQALREKYASLQKQMEAQTEETLRKSEETELLLKQQIDAYKENISTEADELVRRNEELRRELETTKKGADKVLETERARLQEQVRNEYEENERQLQEKYMQLRAELQRESRQLEEKRAEMEQEMAGLKRAQDSIGELNTGAMEEWESERAKLREQTAAMREEVERLKNAQLSAHDLGGDERKAIEREIEQMKEKLQREYQDNEAALRAKYDGLVAELQNEEDAISQRKRELVEREQFLEQEGKRISDESTQVAALIRENVDTDEGRNRILADYRAKLDTLRERLRVNEKAIRENNREFVPLRRIKGTLERDLRLLRKREAVVARQQVLVYGVNNITKLDPERIKKLEQDVQQLSGLQQSVANCEDILSKNKDRFPTLENLDRVLQSQNKQLLSDIEEMQLAIDFLENDADDDTDGDGAGK